MKTVSQGKFGRLRISLQGYLLRLLSLDKIGGSFRIETRADHWIESWKIIKEFHVGVIRTIDKAGQPLIWAIARTFALALI
jgi:hypothetical protein